MQTAAERFSFLVEIGTEELPPKELLSLRDNLRDGLVQTLQKLMHQAAMCAPTDFGSSNNIEAYATPRRLSVRGQNIKLHAPTTTPIQKISGPALATAFDARGKPQKSAIGFAHKHDLKIQTNLADLPQWTAEAERAWAKGRDNTMLICKDEDKLLILKTIPPIAPDQILLQATCEACANMVFKKSMRWGAGQIEFPRPVRWVTLWYNTHRGKSVDTPVQGTVLGVTTTNQTRGHPFISSRAKHNFGIEHYVTYLQEVSVLVSFEERETLIQKNAEKLAKDVGGHIHADHALCQEVSALTEWPVVLRGQFDQRYLKLPAALLISVLREHQRYFPVYKKNNKDLMNAFVFVADNIGDVAKITHGNERVIRPRLADAEFFYRQDCKIPLEKFATGLKQRMFQQNLGSENNSMWHKIERVRKIVGLIATHAQKQVEWKVADLERATLLCKADLQSAVVGEFPKLQGIMGALYAKMQGESDPVVAAISEHYLPRAADDRLPQTALGEALALADRLDTLCACIDAGNQPTGSRDPLGLRRAALGMHRILIEGKYHKTLCLKKLIADTTATLYKGQTTLGSQVFDFMYERFKVWLRQSRQLPSSLIDAVCYNLSSYDGGRDFKSHDCTLCLEQMHEFSHKAVFKELVSLHKRLRNILYKDKSSTPNNPQTLKSILPKPEHFKHSTEHDLFQSLTNIQKSLASMRRDPNFNYADALDLLARLAPPVESFFAQVMVMDADKILRENRLAMLYQLECCLQDIANFSAINIKDGVPL